MKEEVLNWISHFQKATVTFTEGCCYWFAFLLKERYGGKIWYDQVVGHFVCQIDGVFYDVTGIYTPENMSWMSEWEDLQKKEPGYAARIKRDCIDFERKED